MAENRQMTGMVKKLWWLRMYKRPKKVGQTNISAEDHGLSNRSQHHRTQHASTKNGLKSRPCFNSTAQCSPNSPDINSLDFCACGILESKVRTKKYESVDHLIKALRLEWARIPQSHFRAAAK